MKTTEYRALEVEFFDEQPLKSTCLYCDWSFEGTAAESREASLSHRKKKHPDKPIKPHKRRHVRTLSSFRYSTLDDESRVEIEEERRKRAYLNGIEIE